MKVGGVIEKREGDGYVSYLLKEERFYSQTGYKMLLSGGLRSILPCTQIRFNGHRKFVYLSGEYRRRLSRMLPTFGEDEFLEVMTGLIRAVLELKDHPLARACGLELAEDCIFIDHKTKEVYLIYLPVGEDYERTEWFELEAVLRNRIAEWSREMSYSPGDQILRFLSALQETDHSLEEILRRFRPADKPQEEKHRQDIRAEEMQKRESEKMQGRDPEPLRQRESRLCLRYMGTDQKLEFTITGEKFVLGRSPYRADGQISGNLRVGNVHCTIWHRDGQFYAEDMQSRNGTYINGFILKAGEHRLLHQGDILKLADSSFLVEIKES